MKRYILAILAAAILVSIGVYLSRPQHPPVSPPESIAETPAVPSSADEPQPTDTTATTPPPPLAAVHPAEPTPAPAPALAQSTIAPNPALDAALLKQKVDVLISPQSTYQQKRDVWKQLRDAGKLDPVIADLEQRATSEGRRAEIPAALGQAYLQKCATIQDVREQGILAMQADKAFDTALSLDPSNWEARFTKAVAMSYWPPMLNKSDEVIQHFQTLIQQQEFQVPQPQFAESYAWLGDQYQKAGRTDDARSVWERGAYFFPSDEKLRKKLTPTQ